MATILCVDDSETNRYMIEAVLKRAGFTVLTAADGTAGIAAARSERPHLILMDIEMPGIDGFEAARRLKAAPQTKHIPIVALSAHEAGDVADEISASGCDAYITKPVDFRQLLETSARLIGDAETAAAAMRMAGANGNGPARKRG